MSIETELLALKDASGLIHVETAHGWAKSHPKSDLYGAIDWDLERGALQWQFQQIRRIITLHIVYEDRAPRVVSLKIDRVSGGGYRLIDEVIPASDLRSQMLNECLADIERLKNKYSALKEMCRVWDAAEEIKNRQQEPIPRKRAGRR